MTKHSAAFVDLDRTFSKIPVNADVSDDLDLSGRHSRHGDLRWPDLLGHHRVILLSEAGSGKTAEIRNVTRQLRSEGKNAFFLRIENVSLGLEEAVDDELFDAFESWLNSGSEGWLLLDSVDEARLKDPRDFERAIQKIGREIRRAGAYAHIIITGRSTAWRASTDLAICERAFEFEPQARQAPAEPTGGLEDAIKTDADPAPEDKSFLVVTLDDIHGEQIDRFLAATGVNDFKAFLAEVERREAWSLTTRPLDFLELVDFWHQHRRIGSRLELMKSSIDRRLEERDQNRAEFRPIAPEKLRNGARLIAAAATLGQISMICVPDGDAHRKGIPIREVLRDWNDAEAGTLLSRPIFEPSIYGTVRFHHRTVREYLTAEWLHELIRGAASRVKIESLFFRTQYGLQVLNPSMRPVLPWLALLDEPIRTRLEETAPEVFFEGGDPGQLPLSTRRRVLRKACEHLALPAHSWTVTDYSAVQRFAHHDLTEDIKELLTLYRGNDDISWFLLRMVWQGEVVGALAETKQFALHSHHKYTRLAAIRAVIDLGAAQDVAQVRLGLLTGTSKVNREWLAELLEGFVLDNQWLPWLLRGIKRTSKRERYSGRDALALKLSSLATDCQLACLPALIAGFGILLDKPPTTEQGFSIISKKYSWLAEIAGLAVLRLIQARHPFALDEPSLAVLSKLAQAHVYEERDDRELGEKLREMVPSWPELDYKLFWYDVALARIGRVHRGEPVTNVWQLRGFRPYWSLNKQNFSVACDQVVGLTNMHDRLMAFSMASNIYMEHDKPSLWAIQLRQAVVGSDELLERVEVLLNPPDPKVDEWEIKQAEWKEQAAQRAAEDAERHRSWREGLAAEVELINGREPGVMTRSQAYLMQHMRDGSSSSNKWSSGNWQSLITEFGMPVAQAFRAGAIDFWRSYRPTLPSEGAAANSTPYQVIFGLTGLAIESKEATSSFERMSAENAEYAIRYGLLELNGFPEWFPELIRIYPSLTQKILMREINYELDASRPEAGSGRVLQRVRWGGGWLLGDLAVPLMDRLLQPIGDLESLQSLLSIVQDSSVDDEALAKLVSNRAEEEDNLELAPTWYAAWVGVEPEFAIPALAARLDSLSSDDEKANFAMLCAIAIVGSRAASPCRQKYKTVEHSKALYLMMHTYIRIAEDIDRAGKGVYSPGLRDDAQSARDRLLAFIREAPGKEAFLALQDIARAHPAEPLRPWSAFYAQQKATADSQAPPWEPAKVVEFHESLECTPSTHRELWNLAVDRLLDLKYDLEDGDSSYAEILLLTNQETSIRKFIGQWLRDRAAGRYVVPQEEQLADDKRPDYRFQNIQDYAPVPVELKLSQNWSGPAHFERLENQLCGDYLRDVSSSCGIFLLVNHGGRAKWDSPTKGLIGFNELVDALQEHWLTLAPRFPNVEEIMVIGIDLTKRGGAAAAKAIEAN